MKKLICACHCAIVLLAILATPAAASFGINNFHVQMEDEAGGAETHAGAHPYSVSTNLDVQYSEPTPFQFRLDALKDAFIAQVPGFVGNATAVPQCPQRVFLTETPFASKCPDDTAVGFVDLEIITPGGQNPASVFNLEPPKGMVSQLGFTFFGERVTVNIRVSPEPPYNLIAEIPDVSQAVRLFGSKLVLWGVPASASHDEQRGHCLLFGGSCSSAVAEIPFLTNPDTCSDPLATTFTADSWSSPGAFISGEDEQPMEFTGCSRLPFEPGFKATPTSSQPAAPSGFVASLDVEDEGLSNPRGLAQSDIKRAEVTLPEGMEVNSSVANGLVGCSEAQLAEESAEWRAGRGCPEASKIGTVSVETPLLSKSLNGTIYAAEPFRNEFNSLLAIYLVIRNEDLGIIIRQPIRITADGGTGQLLAVADDIPQLPFSHFNLAFREGPRSPLTLPSSCGTYAAMATLQPWSGGPSQTSSSTFSVTGGGSSCAGATFSPKFEAGTVTPLAASRSPFVLNLTRAPGEPAIHSLEATLPEGLLAKLAGVTQCPDAQIAAAEGWGGPNEGGLEQASPSCPASSKIGTVMVGAGSGSLTQVTGTAYLAGPYKGAPLSVAIITPAKAGPFDLGTVVVRNALYVDPTTTQVRAVSDPIPTILQGIPLNIRSISIDLDRSDFMLNPSSCRAMAVLGGATSLLGQTAGLQSRFQVGGCKGLEFKPRLKLQLNGSTRRSGHPALRAVVTFPSAGGSANIARAQVGLPHSEFLDQGNLTQVCTQAELRAATCPASSIYGHAKAWTPLLDKPLEGPVYLAVGFGYELPALVADLNGQVRILLKGRVDTTKQEGIRNTFEAVPDAPVSRFVLEMKGGKKYGLLVNSENICAKSQRATARFVAHNGEVAKFRPGIANDCKSRSGSPRHGS